MNDTKLVVKVAPAAPIYKRGLFGWLDSKMEGATSDELFKGRRNVELKQPLVVMDTDSAFKLFEARWSDYMDYHDCVGAYTAELLYACYNNNIPHALNGRRVPGTAFDIKHHSGHNVDKLGILPPSGKYFQNTMFSMPDSQGPLGTDTLLESRQGETATSLPNLCFAVPGTGAGAVVVKEHGTGAPLSLVPVIGHQWRLLGDDARWTEDILKKLEGRDIYLLASQNGKHWVSPKNAELYDVENGGLK